MACIPPEDKSSCENIPFGISEAAQPIIQVYNECAKMTQDSAVRIKFFVIVSLLATGPLGIAMAGKYAISEGKDEFLKCVLKGLIEAGDGTDEEKALRKDMLDKIFTAKDFTTIPSDIFKGVKSSWMGKLRKPWLSFLERLPTRRNGTGRMKSSITFSGAHRSYFSVFRSRSETSFEISKQISVNASSTRPGSRPQKRQGSWIRIATRKALCTGSWKNGSGAIGKEIPGFLNCRAGREAPSRSAVGNAGKDQSLLGRVGARSYAYR